MMLRLGFVLGSDRCPPVLRIVTVASPGEKTGASRKTMKFCPL
jgi:hypothetical protein